MKKFEMSLLKMSALLLLIILIFSTIYIDSGYVYGVYINGHRIALVNKKETVSKAVDEIKRKIKNEYGLEAETGVNIKEVSVWTKSKLTDYKTLKDNIEKTSDYIVYATVILSDNVPVGYVKNTSEAQAVVNKLLEPYKKMKSANKISDFKMKNNITFKKSNVDLLQISSADDIYQLLKYGANYDRISYNVKDGDTPEAIAKATGTDVGTLEKYNPDITRDIKEYRTLSIIKPTRYFDVLTYEKTTNTVDIPYMTTIKYDSSVAYGSSVEKQKGQNGKKEVVTNIVKDNGIKVSEDTLNETVIQNPVMRILLRGTNRLLATGTFMYPSRGGISSRFGYRSGRMHKGVDIAASYGSEVRASDAGVIKFAGWEEGYGQLITIDHNNGFETYYGHLSKIDVTVGQKVNKGQYIGKVGATGDATGPHLHFEVRKNGVPQNPLSFLK